jgi:hypothetical protein
MVFIATCKDIKYGTYLQNASTASYEPFNKPAYRIQHLGKIRAKIWIVEL